MRTIFFCLAALLFLGSCTKIIQLKNSEGSVCTFKFPKGVKITKITSDDPTLDWLVDFSQNRKIFVSNNDISGSPLNSYKLQEYGENIVVKIVASDSLILTGKNNYGNWKEIKKNGIIYGYMNISDDEIDKFEKLIIPECKSK
ncbi:hypothetical protein Lbys_3288 [Leadbetterella byssophila DSM 17132]|uniref:Lipoprotein n=1 Tax=Leadbetterella byssophila (strain DSM 17132 / JCM 16389 / KACC 11308 / NBRC 106382 / 4M15) TaxID=649349 RepID=E4RWK6_LEAB4|nr:hypothetical protein [Leadbetterella byssophila]ADQ18946.1 hypothetical protein Lbys_3288 [Leadbetterella byssophila DSM 17132]